MFADGIEQVESEYFRRHHRHDPKENQCCSFLVKHIKAPVTQVWSLVRSFDQPQKYKPFISRCVVQGNMEIGSVREVNVKSGLPATTSTEKLEVLDDDEHVLSVKIVGGDHRLKTKHTNNVKYAYLVCEVENLIAGAAVSLSKTNYSSVISVHPEIIDGRPGTLVIESFVVDVPEGNTDDDTRMFVEALIGCNLNSLADVSERMDS